MESVPGDVLRSGKYGKVELHDSSGLVGLGEGSVLRVFMLSLYKEDLHLQN